MKSARRVASIDLLEPARNDEVLGPDRVVLGQQALDVERRLQSPASVQRFWLEQRHGSDLCTYVADVRSAWRERGSIGSEAGDRLPVGVVDVLLRVRRLPVVAGDHPA